MASNGFCSEAAEVYISSTKAATKTSVIVPDFVREGGFEDKEGRDRQMADILADDLNFSGYFDAKRVKEVKGDPSTWSSLGVADIVQGSYSTDGREIEIKGKVVDASRGAVVLNRSYPESLRVMRSRIHKLADEVIFQLTGEKGICQTKIAFVSDMTGNNELYISDFDGHGVYRMTRDEGTCLLPAWSPSGSYITYTSYKRVNPDLWWVSSSAKSRGIISFYPGLNTASSWSPDGNKIAVTLSKDGNAEIYTMNRDGAGLKRLTFSPSIDTSPTWSPNGREIAFNSDRSGTPQIYVMDADGGNVRRLTYMGKYNASPAWSPDGRHIVFSSTRGGGKALYEMDPNGGNPRKLPIPGNSQTPAWSPRFNN